MRMRTRLIYLLAAVVLAATGCSESNRNTSPVELRAATQINEPFVDLAAPPDAEAVADVLLTLVQKNPDATSGTFNDVKLRSYRVSYVRTDGGTTVPASFVVPVNQLLEVGQPSTVLDNFIAFEPTARNNAPFAALLPQNGGRDAQTGRQFIDMDVRVEIFGETLAGEDVYAATRFPVTFCYGCT